MALTRDVVLRLLGDSDSAVRATKAAADAAGVAVSAYRRAEREMAKQAATAKRLADEQHAAMERTGRAMMIGGAVIAAGLGLAAKAAVDWESAWAGVQKTVDGSPEEMAALEGELRKLATTLPATHAEIAAVAEAAGQLGIKREDVAAFTETAIAMGVSTNLSAEEAATGMARLSNIMGTSSSDVDRMGSALVALGNAGASTEGEILAMALRIGAAGRQAGMTEGEVLALANAMSSLGIEAEAGGTAISTVIKKVNSAVIDGGEELEAYAEIAGMTASAFATAWRRDAAGALSTFVAGLQRVQESGGNVNAVLEDMGLDGIRVSDTLLRLGGDVDGLNASLALGNQAWAENDALMNEANKRYETSASKIQIARNAIADAAIDVGALLLPALASVVETVADFARGFSELPGPVKTAVVILGSMAAAIGLVGGAALTAIPKLVVFRETMRTLGTTGAAGALGRFGLFMTGPWGAALGVATLGLGGLIAALGGASRASEEAVGYQRDLADALRESGGVLDDNVRALAAAKAADSEFADSDLLEWAERIGVKGSVVTDMLLGSKPALEEFTAALDAYAQAGMDAAVANGTMDTADFSWVPGLKDHVNELAGSMGGAVAENQRLADAQRETGESAGQTTTSMDSLAGVTGEVAGNAEDAASAAEKLMDALDALNGPALNMRDAARGFQEAIDKASDSVEEHGRTLDVNTEAGRANQAALDSIAKAAAEQGEAILNSGGSYDQFRNSLQAGRAALIRAAQDMGMTRQQAEDLADQILAIPEAHEIDVSSPNHGRVMEQLQSVQAKVKGLPPGHTVNVGVLSAAAIEALDQVGIKTRTLPDGTIQVTTSGTASVEDALNWLARERTAVIHAYTVGQRAVGRGHQAWDGGRVPAYAGGGAPLPGNVVLVGERGPELVAFGANGYVTPADLTRNALAAGARFSTPGGAPGMVSNDYSRTYAPRIEVHNHGRDLSARDVLNAARDHEWLHGG